MNTDLGTTTSPSKIETSLLVAKSSRGPPSHLLAGLAATTLIPVPALRSLLVPLVVVVVSSVASLLVVASVASLRVVALASLRVVALVASLPHWRCRLLMLALGLLASARQVICYSLWCFGQQLHWTSKKARFWRLETFRFAFACNVRVSSALV